MARPLCRVCGSRVKYFGDVCPECEGDALDGLNAIVRADLAALDAQRDDD